MRWGSKSLSSRGRGFGLARRWASFKFSRSKRDLEIWSSKTKHGGGLIDAIREHFKSQSSQIQKIEKRRWRKEVAFMVVYLLSRQKGSGKAEPTFSSSSDNPSLQDLLFRSRAGIPRLSIQCPPSQMRKVSRGWTLPSRCSHHSQRVPWIASSRGCQSDSGFVDLHFGTLGGVKTAILVQPLHWTTRPRAETQRAGTLLILHRAFLAVQAVFEVDGMN